MCGVPLHRVGRVGGFLCQSYPMKRPAFQFYPADWRKDPALRACSIEARGFWIDLLCIMHESENCGFLEINSKKISEKALASMCGITPTKCRKYLTELEENGVFSKDDRGVIFSRRMVRDKELSEIRREAGKQGGNPALVKQQDKQKPAGLHNQNGNQNPTPSSSSSSSTSVIPPLPPNGGNGASKAEWWRDDNSHAPCSEEDAVQYAATLKISERAARYWWHNRNAAGWTKGSANGAPARKITSWQSDLTTSQRWAEEEAHKPANGGKPRRNNAEDFSL
jgi:hypothetical protein